MRAPSGAATSRYETNVDDGQTQPSVPGSVGAYSSGFSSCGPASRANTIMLRPAPPAPMTLESNRNPVPAWIRSRTSLLVVCLLVLLPARQTFGQDAIARGTSWQARWIGVAEEGDRSPPNTWICFRREVELARAPQRVSARIAVDSRYWLWINGELAVSSAAPRRRTPTTTRWISRVAGRRERIRSSCSCGTSASTASRTRAAGEHSTLWEQ